MENHCFLQGILASDLAKRQELAMHAYLAFCSQISRVEKRGLLAAVKDLVPAPTQ
jgi:hypothetical protein